MKMHKTCFSCEANKVDRCSLGYRRQDIRLAGERKLIPLEPCSRPTNKIKLEAIEELIV